MRKAVLILLSLSAAGFSERAVSLAESGHPALFLGLAGLFALIFSSMARLYRKPLRPPKPWCRIVPDPLQPELSDVPRGLRLAAEEARVQKKDIWVELLPLFNPDASPKPYSVYLDTTAGTGKKSVSGRNAPRAVRVPLPEGDAPNATKIFRVNGPGSVLVRLRPLAGSSHGGKKLEVWHDASPPLSNSGVREPILLGASAGLLFWNLARFSPYANEGPPPGLPVAIGIVFAWLLISLASRERGRVDPCRMRYRRKE